MMKEKLLRLGALMLVLWYSFSVIGFDIHTCSASDHSFIATFISGMSCDDIHPHHHCGDESCTDHAVSHCTDHHHSENCCHSHHAEGFSYSESHCCSDDYMALSITGKVSENDSRTFISFNPDIFPASSDCMASASIDRFFTTFHKGSVKGLLPSRDIMSLHHIWRI